MNERRQPPPPDPEPGVRQRTQGAQAFGFQFVEAVDEVALRGAASERVPRKLRDVGQELNDECERRLARHRASLIGEVAWDDEFVKTLQRFWTLVAKRRAFRRTAKRFPVALAVHLVTVANRTYEAGDLWSSFPHIVSGDHAVAGQAFERALLLRGLERFPQFAHEGAHRYVARILAHGGIPQRLVGTFLQRLLLPTLRNGEGSTAEELIGRWRTSAPAGIPRPVLRFLRYGGAVAADFVERCIEMMRFDREDLRNNPGMSGLPQGVVEAFLEIPEPEVARLSAQIRPVIRLDPWDDRGPVVVLPPVGRERAAELSWIVEDREQRTYPASAHGEREVEVGPADHWTISAKGGTQAVRPVRVEGLGATRIVCFDEGGIFVPDERGLRADHLWIIAPTDAALVSIGDSGEQAIAPLENGAVLRGAWTGYQVRRYALEGVEALGVRVGNTITGVVRVVRAGDRPRLVGEPVRDVVSIDQVPVYREMPRLSLPSGRWKVVLAQAGREAARDLDTYAAGEPVSLAELWGNRTFGLFRVYVRGPLGRDMPPAEFAVVPGLRVGTPDEVVAPSAGTLEVELGASPPITLHPNVLLLGAEEDAGEAWAWIGHREKLGLIVRIPRLRWGIRYRDRAASLGTVRLSVSPDELGTEAEALVIAVGRAGRTAEVRLEADRQVSHVETTRPTNEAGTAVLRLAAFRDTARAAGSGFRLTVSVERVTAVVAEYRPTRHDEPRPRLPAVGEQVEGRVVDVLPGRLRVEGNGWTGLIQEDRLAKHAHEYRIGDHVSAWVIRGTGQGLLLDAIPFDADEFRPGENVDATVVGIGRDRVWLDIRGARGRLPEEHMPRGLAAYRRGQPVRVRVTSIDRRQRVINVTARLTKPEDFPVGATRRGRVLRVARDRMTVDLRSALGVVRRGETDLGRALESYRVGEMVKGTVVKVNAAQGCVELSLRPWAPGVREGDRVEGRVHRLNPRNVLVRLPSGAIGGLAFKGLPPHMVAAPQEYFAEGASVPVRVTWIDDRARRIGLALDVDTFTFGEDDDDSPFSILRSGQIKPR